MRTLEQEMRDALDDDASIQAATEVAKRFIRQAIGMQREIDANIAGKYWFPGHTVVTPTVEGIMKDIATQPNFDWLKENDIME
jgi:hypothetical protein